MKGSTGSNLQIPFKLESGKLHDFSELQRFWHAPLTVSWFRERGYVYPPSLSNNLKSKPPGVLHEVNYPYASYDCSEIMPQGALNISGKVLFAQDSLGRHVAIKIVRTDSDEHRVLRFLNEHSLDTLKANCLIPVLDFLPNGNYVFVVMPRWGSSIHLPWITKAREILEIMHSMLKALAFLHKNNIAHGDINDSNVLVNHFSDSSALEDNWIRAELRSKEMLSYAVFDFDFSVILPPEVDRTKYRLPYERSWGTFNYTMDTAQGEFDYNPFVLDVGILGVRFCYDFQHLTGEIPMLAPLLDKMTTRDLDHRFTALEALNFFDELFAQLTKEELECHIQTQFRELDLDYDEYDRWKHVPQGLHRSGQCSKSHLFLGRLEFSE
ncbi:kinase-like domain-containing protein [Gymnopilus junonius]|uniref:Kinase-like domain-containing protein n=1 Tax=Gymnopilus junonius TaxID=109634 RepID=A0A9P5TRP2_GYMJU|nr:kinase-like domain-containing protein [Gymnopilus junonius]